VSVRSAGAGLPGVGEGLDQRAHLPGLSGPDVAERGGHHDGGAEHDARLHTGLAAHEVPLEAEVVVDPPADAPAYACRVVPNMPIMRPTSS